MLEEYVRLFPWLRPEGRRPVEKLLLPIVLASQPEVAPTGCGDPRRGQILVLGQAEGATGGPESLVDRVLEPGFATELGRAARRGRERRQKVGQARGVFLEVRRQLKEHRAESIPQSRRDAKKEIHGVTRFLQSPDVRDALRRLQSEAKSVGHLLGPLRQGLGPGHPVEGVVDLDGRKLRSIEAQHLRGGKVFRVEASLPLFVRETARADEEPHRVTRSRYRRGRARRLSDTP